MIYSRKVYQYAVTQLLHRYIAIAWAGGGADINVITLILSSHFLTSLVQIRKTSSIVACSSLCPKAATMSFLDTLRQWDEAATCADRQDLSEALRIFLSIQKPNSKIYFDIGCLHLLNQDLDAAEKV